jgi:hypothetical protein
MPYCLVSVHTQEIQEKAPDTPPVSNLSDIRGSDIEAAHCITCPVCTTKYSPKLHISCYKLKPNPTPLRVADPFSSTSPRLTSTADWTQSPSPSPSAVFSPGSAVPSSPDPSPLVPPSGGARRSSKLGGLEYEEELKVLWRETVAYLSPKGLRLALEEQMERIGERVADPCWLHVHRPAVYWNILWFSSRLKVPTGFLASPVPAAPRTPCGTCLDLYCSFLIPHKPPQILFHALLSPTYLSSGSCNISFPAEWLHRNRALRVESHSGERGSSRTAAWVWNRSETRHRRRCQPSFYVAPTYFNRLERNRSKDKGPSLPY